MQGQSVLGLLLLAALTKPPPAAAAPTAAGGAASAFTKVVNDSAGVWWLSRRGDDSSLLLSLGVVAVQYGQFRDWRTGIDRYQKANDARYRGNRSAWADASASLMARLGFNTMGAWSDPHANSGAARAGMLYTPIAAMGWPTSDGYSHFPDVFSPAFAGNASIVAQQKIAPHANDSALIGWFSDNELRWYLDFGPASGQRHATGTNLLWQFLAVLPSDSPGRAAAGRFLSSRMGTDHPAQRLLTTSRPLAAGEAELLWHATIPHEASFAYNCSRAYFSQVSAAIKAVDPNHLILGAKFTGIDGTCSTVRCSDGFDAVLRGSRGLVDAHSFDVYGFTPGRSTLQHYYELTGVPWILAESMGFKASDNLSEDPNTLGAGPVVPDQAARATAWSVFARKTLSLPFVVGLHHFAWVDEPAGGRGGGSCPPIGTGKPCGEDSNYGVVSVDGRPYTTLQAAMAELLPRAAEMHRAGTRCSLDTAVYGAQPGRLQLPQSSGAAAGATLECLAATASGSVAVAPCVVGSAAQTWEVLKVGGAVGKRLRNAGSGGCLSIPLGDMHSHTLRADGNCSTPRDWLWPPAWEHDEESCSLMQSCQYPSNWATMHNVCKYDQSCAGVEGAIGTVVGSCNGSASQRFAFVS